MKNIIIIFSFLILILLPPLLNVQCTSSKNNESETKMNKPSIKEVIQKRSKEIMSIPGIEGLYQGETNDSKPCIKVMVATESDSVNNKIPKMLDGYPVIIEVTGKIIPMK